MLLHSHGGTTQLNFVILPLLHWQGGAMRVTRYAMADVYVYMAVNKMSNLIDFKHQQTFLLSVAYCYARINTFSSIAGIYYDDDKIVDVKTPTFLP